MPTASFEFYKILLCALAFFVLAAALSGCAGGLPAAGEQREAIEEPRQYYHLGAGDKLRVITYDEPELSGSFSINGQGNISMPLVGSVKLQGKTVHEAEDALEDRLRDGYLKDPRVSVEVTEYRPFYILGEVGNPGQYSFDEGITIIKAVARAGGFTYRAEKKYAEILRTPSGVPEIEKAKIHEHVLPGDVIYVKESLF